MVLWALAAYGASASYDGDDSGVVAAHDGDSSAASKLRRPCELFPVYALKNKCSAYCASTAASRTGPVEMVSAGQNPKVVKALEMLALNDDLETGVKSDNMCTRRAAMARAAGLAFGLSMAAVSSALGVKPSSSKMRCGRSRR